MADFNPRIDDNDPTKKIGPPPIGNDDEAKKRHDKYAVYKNLFLYLAFLYSMKSFFAKFANAPVSFKESHIHQDLLDLKTSFLLLSRKNVSEDVSFLNYLAFKWLKLTKDFGLYPLANEALTVRIKKIIDDINQFPEEEGYSLGYYLSNFAGFKWIPRPYIKILETLHLESVNKNPGAHLKKWLDSISLLLEEV